MPPRKRHPSGQFAQAATEHWTRTTCIGFFPARREASMKFRSATRFTEKMCPQVLHPTMEYPLISTRDAQFFIGSRPIYVRKPLAPPRET
jgi:hypothetical protein